LIYAHLGVFRSALDHRQEQASGYAIKDKSLTSILWSANDYVGETITVDIAG
jgi:hypothetical protein